MDKPNKKVEFPIHAPVKCESVTISIPDKEIVVTLRNGSRFLRISDTKDFKDEIGRFVADALNEKLNSIK